MGELDALANDLLALARRLADQIGYVQIREAGVPVTDAVGRGPTDDRPSATQVATPPGLTLDAQGAALLRACWSQSIMSPLDLDLALEANRRARLDAEAHSDSLEAALLHFTMRRHAATPATCDACANAQRLVMAALGEP